MHCRSDVHQIDVHLPVHAAFRVATLACALALLLAMANGQAEAEAPAAAPETSAAAGEAAQPAHGIRQLPWFRECIGASTDACSPPHPSPASLWACLPHHLQFCSWRVRGAVCLSSIAWVLMTSAFTSLQHLMRIRCSAGHLQALTRPSSWHSHPVTPSAVVTVAHLRRVSRPASNVATPVGQDKPPAYPLKDIWHQAKPCCTYQMCLLHSLAPQQDLKACSRLLVPSAGAQAGVAAPAASPVAAAPAEQPAAVTSGQAVGFSPAATAPSAFGGTPAATPKVRNVLLIR